MTAELQAALVGPTGYAGQELTRLLFQHPRLKPPLLLARDATPNDAKPASLGGPGSGEPATEILSPVDGSPVAVHPFSWKLLHQRGVDLLFLATPHEVSRALVPAAVRHGLRVVDLSGAWRLRSPENAAVYAFEDADAAEAAALAAKAVYGIPELCRGQLADAQVVANPGCYPTSVILALAPLLEAGLLDVEHGIICDAKSGVSGAGKNPTQQTHFVETAENFRAYAAFTHRHTGEILEQLGLEPQQLVFSTHLLPIRRGILSSIYARLKRPVTPIEIEQCLREFYARAAFVRVFAPPRLPEVQFAQHTNFCDIGWVLAPDRQRIMLVSCIDNLLKGAAGQAVQNMNVMYGWDEREGLLPAAEIPLRAGAAVWGARRQPASAGLIN
jgi:N-acetyl-gamma-glutamyl-phosphate reductase